MALNCARILHYMTAFKIVTTTFILDLLDRQKDEFNLWGPVHLKIGPVKKCLSSIHRKWMKWMEFKCGMLKPRSRKNP